jgi:hypothetical protein
MEKGKKVLDGARLNSEGSRERKMHKRRKGWLQRDMSPRRYHAST